MNHLPSLGHWPHPRIRQGTMVALSVTSGLTVFAIQRADRDLDLSRYKETQLETHRVETPHLAAVGIQGRLGAALWIFLIWVRGKRRLLNLLSTWGD